MGGRAPRGAAARGAREGRRGSRISPQGGCSRAQAGAARSARARPRGAAPTRAYACMHSHKLRKEEKWGFARWVGEMWGLCRALRFGRCGVCVGARPGAVSSRGPRWVKTCCPWRDPLSTATMPANLSISKKLVQRSDRVKSVDMVRPRCPRPRAPPCTSVFSAPGRSHAPAPLTPPSHPPPLIANSRAAPHGALGDLRVVHWQGGHLQLQHAGGGEVL